MEETRLVLPHDKPSISYLPNELLEAIFKAGVADSRQGDAVPFPFLVSAASGRKWYNIAGQLSRALVPQIRHKDYLHVGVGANGIGPGASILAVSRYAADVA